MKEGNVIMEKGLHKRYGLMTAICMVVGIVVGSGVFFKAQSVLQSTHGDMPLGILAWIIGGLVMLVCALGFSTLATKYEKVNGIVDYAEATVGPRYAYFVGWFTATIYYPAMTSVLAWLTARYTLEFVHSMNPDLVLSEGGPVVGTECMVLALLFMCFAYAVNALSPKLAGHFQVTTTIIKLVPLVLMAVVGIIYGISTGQLTENFTTAADFAAEETVVNVSPLFGAVVATAFAYEGWIIATSINSEIKDSKKNLPIALTVGSLIIMAIYVLYYIGVAGGASNEQLINEGATVAFTNIFGNILGNVLNLFVAVSCFGTLNGLMLASTRGIYAIAARGEGPAHEVFGQIDEKTNMAHNSAIFGLMVCACWFVFFYGANLAPSNWFGLFSFDSSELPIITIYAVYFPIFISFMKKGKEFGAVRRYVIPGLALAGSAFMVIAAVFAHGIKPYLTARAAGGFAMPVLFYLIVFAAIMAFGAIFRDKKK